jgi:hypothetical protein
VAATAVLPLFAMAGWEGYVCRDPAHLRGAGAYTHVVAIHGTITHLSDREMIFDNLMPYLACLCVLLLVLIAKWAERHNA